jgi:hypothetical protein
MGPTKLPSKFSGVNGPNEVGASRRMVRGCKHALIESERIDEGLERRSGRAFGEDAVDLAVNGFLFVVIGRAHPGFDGHVAVSTSRVAALRMPRSPN